ncbi:hypothetical protein [Alicyclobacillus suci]|uniref:hypothetical protein n=1 Tax=Alicyclobacillus suci TaxID=2816080 RepID=UPI001A8E247A|nr:hypothetical protein [Alicyclobacillus suci]
MLYSLPERLPAVWIALVIAGFVAWMYLKFTGKNDPIAIAVKDRVSGVVLAYIFFSKFVGGLVLHPSLNWSEDILSMLGGSATDGWPIGVLAAILYLMYGLRKSKVLGRRAFVSTAEGVVSGSILLFAYLAVVNLDPFRLEYILRAFGACLLLMLIRRYRRQPNIYPQRLWAAFGILLFLTSVLVPHTTVFIVFRPSQWFYIAIIVVSLIAEGVSDFKGTSESQNADLSQDDHIEHDFD